jgi:hypothetical protein
MRSLTAWVRLGRHLENEALYDGRAQRARLQIRESGWRTSFCASRIAIRTNVYETGFAILIRKRFKSK